MPITSTTESSWRTIIPADPATLPTGRDCNMFGRVRWRWADGQIEDQPPSFFELGENNPVAWMPIPPYTPPEPVKRCYVSGDSEDIALVFEAVNSRIDTSGSWTHQAELRDLSRRLWKTNIDPDAAIRLRNKVEKFIETLDNPCSRFVEIEARTELRDALREAAK